MDKIIDKESILRGAGIQTHQKDVDGLKGVANSIGTKTIVEIGVSEGRSLFEWASMLEEDGLLIGIDAHNIVMWDTSIMKCKIETIEGESTEQAVEDQLVKILGDRNIDFIWIDGGHSYSTVKNDHERFSKYVRSGGLVAFHDNISSKDVGRYVKELSSKHDIKYIPDGTRDTVYYIK